MRVDALLIGFKLNAIGKIPEDIPRTLCLHSGLKIRHYHYGRLSFYFSFAFLVVFNVLLELFLLPLDMILSSSTSLSSTTGI